MIQQPTRSTKGCIIVPYTQPLKKVDDFINSQVKMTRALNPLNPYSDEQVYEFFFRQFVYSTYPAKEPIVLENPYKLEAVFRLSQGVGSFIPMDNAIKLKVNTYMFVPMKDEYFPAAEYESLWNLIPETSRKGIFYLKNSKHKIPEVAPKESADLIENIFNSYLGK